MSRIKQTLKYLLHDKYINKTTYDDKIFLYINDLKNAYTLHQIKDIETNFNEDCLVIGKIYNEITPIDDLGILEEKDFQIKNIMKSIQRNEEIYKRTKQRICEQIFELC